MSELVEGATLCAQGAPALGGEKLKQFINTERCQSGRMGLTRNQLPA